ncbi:MAG: CheB methylesterase domain-containing protein, partial [Thermodesulfobacteriota bacterium]|nr:CheB methylesterase domain-containing protein [Thermodesulfobacteriota bacterium]
SVYIAPGGKQMLFRKGAAREICVAVTDDPPEDGCRPSVNVLFRSAAKIFGGDVITLVLTGMGSDGVKGLEDLKKAGAYVIAQDEATSVVWGMPGNAVSSGCVDKVLSPGEIPGEIISIVKGS